MGKTPEAFDHLEVFDGITWRLINWTTDRWLMAVAQSLRWMNKIYHSLLRRAPPLRAVGARPWTAPVGGARGARAVCIRPII